MKADLYDQLFSVNFMNKMNLKLIIHLILKTVTFRKFTVILLLIIKIDTRGKKYEKYMVDCYISGWCFKHWQGVDLTMHQKEHQMEKEGHSNLQKLLK